MNAPASAPAPAAAVHPVSLERHAGKRWRRFGDYRWAAQQSLVPLFAPELASAAAQFPIAFIEHAETVIPVGLLGLEPGVNLFVAGDGRWLGGYVPAALRTRPFALHPTADGKRVLCVDEAAAGLVQGEAPDTEPFFTPEGELAPVLRDVMAFVSRIEDAKAPTTAAAGALKKHGVLVPWPMKLETDQGPREVQGLFKADEAAVAVLPDDAYLELRRAQSLPLLYAHLLSQQHMQLLGQLARARAQALAQQKVMPVTPGGELDLSFMEGGDTLRFS